nr:FUSC family protein [Nocardioides marinus]
MTVGRRSYRARVARFRAKRWQVAQCAVAAAVAWLVARHALGHEVPVFAPIAAVLALGTSYGQRLRRVAEITVGVAIGVLLADLLVALLGTGAWQLGLIVALAMTVGILLDGGTMLVNQAAIQSIFVVALLPGTGGSLTRWTDALVGGAVALVAATIVPAAALRRPREQASVVLRKQARLLRGVAQVLREGDADLGAELLAEARSTEPLIRELEDAAAEGMAVVTSSPFRVRHKPTVRRMSDLVVPLDRSMRSCRVLVRQAAVAAHRRRPVPPAYAALAEDLAFAVEVMVAELAEERMPVAARPALLTVGKGTGEVVRSDEMTADMVLGLLRAVVADLLMITGMDAMQASDALPPPPR